MKLLTWICEAVKRLWKKMTVVGTETSAPTALAHDKPVTSGGGDNDKAREMFNAVLAGCYREKPVFRLFAKPITGVGSHVIFETTRRYQLATRITRSDGRIYEVYRVKNTQHTRIEPTGPMPILGVAQ